MGMMRHDEVRMPHLKLARPRSNLVVVVVVVAAKVIDRPSLIKDQFILHLARFPSRNNYLHLHEVNM
eukprot:gene12866-biopygen16442